jgi:hypothetical protein
MDKSGKYGVQSLYPATRIGSVDIIVKRPKNGRMALASGKPTGVWDEEARRSNT